MNERRAPEPGGPRRFASGEVLVHVFSIHSRSPALAALACLVLGCSQPGADEAATFGTLSMPLATVVNGVHYRLSGDSFFVTGPVSRDLEPNGSGVIVYATLPAGAYEVGLRDGWALERQGEDGFEAVEAELISPNPRQAQIESGSTTILAWVFRTDALPVGLEPPGVVQGNLSVLDSSNPVASLAGDLLLGTQAHVDGLQGVEAIDGSLAIDGSGDVESLAALASLTRVEGDLVLEASGSLSNLEGLAGLAHIGGTLRLTGNTVLTSLRALTTLQTVGAISITENASLPSCEAQWLVDHITDTLGGSIGQLQPDASLEPGSVILSGNDGAGTCP
jgi:hypothetical protein